MIRILGRALIPRQSQPATVESRDGLLHVLEGSILAPGKATGAVYRPEDVRLLCPVEPSKVVGAAVNYHAHAAEMGKAVPTEPLYFIKPSTSVIGPDEVILLPPDSAEVHHEAEMAVVIGRKLHRASPDEAMAAIQGVTGCVDVTARDLQRKYANYSRSKTYDTFCPLGPFVACGLSPDDLRVQLRVNGQTRQDGRTSDMVFSTGALVSAISHTMTLLPGDVVITGTPPGVGPLSHGDRVELEVEGVGVLSLRVARA